MLEPGYKTAAPALPADSLQDKPIYDQLANPAEVKHEYNLETTKILPEGKFDTIVLTVTHKEFLKMDLEHLKIKGAMV